MKKTWTVALTLLQLFLFSDVLFAQTTSADTITIVGRATYAKYGKTLNLKQMQRIMKPYPQSYKYISDARSNQLASTMLGVVGGFGLGFMAGARIAGYKPNTAGWIAIGASFGVIVISIPPGIKSRKQAKQAVYAYNKAVKIRSSLLQIF